MRASEFVHCRPSRRAGDGAAGRFPAPIFLGGRLRLRESRAEREFAEADYRDGSGPLRLRLVRVDWARAVVREGVTWRTAEGVEIDSTGREGGRRRVLIRAERLPGPPARQRPRLRV